MFVCNKVDTSAGAATFDTRSSDELDSDEEETVTKVDKQKIVFSQLQQHGLIGDSESYDTCSSFYGISAQNAREDRRKKICSRATELFSKFEDGLLGILEDTIKRETKQVVSKLIFLQMSLVAAMDRTKQVLPSIFGSPLEFDTAKSVEKSLHTTLTETIASEEKIEMLVNCKVLGLKEKFLPEALQYRTRVQVPDDAVFSSIAKLQELEESLTFLHLALCTVFKPQYNFPLSWNKDDTPFLRFVISMKGVILDKTFNDLRRAFEGFLYGVKSLVEVHSKHIVNPPLRHALALAYGSSLSKTKDSSPDQPSEGLFVHLTSLVSKVLRTVLSEVLIEGLLEAMEWKSSNANLNIADEQSRREILEIILSKFSAQRIAHSISVALKDHLEKAHDSFFKVIDTLTAIIDVVSNSSQQLEEMAAIYIPTVRHLVVQGFAL